MLLNQYQLDHKNTHYLVSPGMVCSIMIKFSQWVLQSSIAVDIERDCGTKTDDIRRFDFPAKCPATRVEKGPQR